MSFRTPLLLLGLVLVPLLIAAHRRRRRADAAATRAFAATPLLPSVAPRRPGWRAHVPAAAVAGALTLLVLAAARPQRTVAVTLPEGAVVLADDTSSSMAATDVRPTRLGAAVAAARRFIATVPGSIRVGVETFAGRPLLLQSPTTDHTTAAGALSGLHAGGHTAIGDALNLALSALAGQRGTGGTRVPAAIVLLSDGTSTVGADPLTAARRAATQHVAVYTVSVGTPDGTIGGGPGRKTIPVPVDPSELEQIARLSGGRSYAAGNAAGLRAVYTGLARHLSRHREHHQLTASFAGAGFLLLLAGGGMSLFWFGRPVP